MLHQVSDALAPHRLATCNFCLDHGAVDVALYLLRCESDHPLTESHVWPLFCAEPVPACSFRALQLVVWLLDCDHCIGHLNNLGAMR